MRKRSGQPIPSSLDDATQCQLAAAEKIGLVPKRMSDLMGVDIKTYYRWMAENSMPLNRIRQWEAFSKASFVSDYLCMSHGNQWLSPSLLAKSQGCRFGRDASQLWPGGNATGAVLQGQN